MQERRIGKDHFQSNRDYQPDNRGVAKMDDKQLGAEISYTSER